jgi:hypothetical protein
MVSAGCRELINSQVSSARVRALLSLECVEHSDQMGRVWSRRELKDDVSLSSNPLPMTVPPLTTAPAIAEAAR